MLSVKNISDKEQVWGGTIFTKTQERIVDADFKATLSNDSQFYEAILSGVAQIYSDMIFVENKILACELIRNEMKKDEEGNIIARYRQVPENYRHRAKCVLITTANQEGIDQEFWPLEHSKECSLKFLTNKEGSLVETSPESSTYTKFIWTPSYKVMQSKAHISVSESHRTLKGWVGIEGYEKYEQGRLYLGFRFFNKTVWEVTTPEPRNLPAPFFLLLAHGEGEQITINLMFEYFTNFEPFEHLYL